MIPVRLQMKNFLPYRGSLPPFSFEGIHLACITGDNGAGKTSIIDAMTWALWGKSRLRSRSTTDDDLITQGESETEIIFDFRAGDGQVHRVIRRRVKPRKTGGVGQSSLALYLVSQEGLKSISGNTIGETEDKIKKIIHLDYDTFVSSAYLKQGEADHFTGLTASQRKEVLVSILGLDAYDELADKAKDKANQAASAKNLLAQSIELEQCQLERRPALESSLAAARRELTDTEAALIEKRAAMETMRQARQLIESYEQSLTRAEAAAKEIFDDLSLRKTDGAETEKRIAIHRAVLADRAEVESNYSRYIAARQANDEYGIKLAEVRRLESERQIVEKKVIEARHLLENKRASWQAKYEELLEKSRKLSELRLNADSLKLELEKLADRERLLEGDKLRLQAFKVELSAIGAAEQGQVQRLAEITEKLKLLTSTGEAAVCPVCDAELGGDRFKMVQSKYNAERAAADRRLAELTAEMADKACEISSLERRLAFENTIKAERAHLNTLEARLLNEIAEAEAAAGRLPEGERKIAEITRLIAQHEYAHEERQALNSLDEIISRLDYDSAKHKTLIAQVKSLECWETRRQELAQAEKLLAREESNFKNNQAAVQELEERLRKRLTEVEELRQALAELPGLEAQDLAAAETELKVLAATTSQAAEHVGSLKQGLSQLYDLEQKLAEQTVKMKKHAADEGIYKELHLAFGKNGIQAVLIENAVPEVEAEANRLLARMTDNRMSLKLELQRATRKGELAETFDIKIGDELGTRDYDLFSGGEAFRINFALRLALSRVLAHRAGAPLRTLIIDEGFGTQDTTGIEKLKEAIASIQDQFDCILVITHIEEFKDAFPARIEVVKTSDGSSIRVSYN
ncbi:ATPase involved in DNA repair [Dehalogenimonas alkenigignens]|uniref:Nuclease SbcCD subunit C n=1 Tax=Dehalogenimonas alkenigignens TaxID=1217799 RepID=A0A0W0GIZ8_9CHLR|nr:SMC family ATPase [Dehalogenimonas alkenigignens]KTB48544.1 ATPase involved in DNA repair [Dehalogenimonas alkenigignens]